MSTAINIQSGWNRSISAHIFRDGNEFCMKATDPETRIPVRFKVDSAKEIVAYLTDQIAQAEAIKGPWEN